MKIETKTFGVIDIGEESPYLKQLIQVNGRSENCGLYIAAEFSKDASSCRRIGKLIDEVDAFDARGRDILSRRLQNEDAVVVDFLDFHLEELVDELKAKLRVSTIDRGLLLEKLDLRSLGFHLGEDGIEFWCDFSAGENFSDERLVVKFRANGELVEVAHES